MKLLMKTKLHEKGNSSNDLKKKKKYWTHRGSNPHLPGESLFLFFKYPKALI